MRYTETVHPKASTGHPTFVVDITNDLLGAEDRRRVLARMDDDNHATSADEVY